MHEQSSHLAFPTAFCWTRMGDESGENLGRIMRRKELERKAEGGTFLWGIGNGLGDGLRQLVATHNEPVVLFSPIRSSAALNDREPESVLVWLDYLGDDGMPQPLPAASYVTSRGPAGTGSSRLAHYALFCHSLDPLGTKRIGTLQFHELRNLATQKPVGFSQVTAVVSRDAATGGRDLPYHVVMSAHLQSPFFARLASPITLDDADAELIDVVAASGNADLWRCAIISLKNRYREALVAAVRQPSLFVGDSH